MRELELQTLQYQINPHFLFNTLNTLKWIATLNHVTPVSHGIDALSSLLQSTLIKKDELIPFDDELRNLKNYCDIQQLRYKRRGEYGVAGGERGDLVVTTHVEEHPLFKRKGADVTMEVPISVYEAALGCTVDVPTPGGATVRLKVPAGTQTGKKFRFKEMGAPDVKHRGRTGALLVEIKVQVPTNLSDDERDAMTKLREADTRDYREKVNRYKATY